MRTDDFSFDLPEERVAQYPPERRGESRLLVMDRGGGDLCHAKVADLASYVPAGALMVFNDSRVRKARLHAEAEDSGARVEFLLVRRLDEAVWEVAATKLKRQRPGRSYRFAEGVRAVIVESPATGPGGGDTRRLRFDPPVDEAWIERVGHIPLPPYIKREDAALDQERYQTVYARELGSAAAPTAGLHFTRELLDSLSARGVESARVTLHVGLGTFMPVRVDNIEDHRMHEEEYSIPTETCDALRRAKAEGRPVIAVGTTSLRCMESAWDEDAPGGPGLRAGGGSTDIFISPGYRFRAADWLFTNFHTPRSTLLMLVSAFAGREAVLDAYAKALELDYRFFSYGDAMLIRGAHKARDTSPPGR